MATTNQAAMAPTRELPLESMEVVVPATLLVQHEGTCSADPAAIAATVGASLGAVQAFVHRYALQPAGPARVIYRKWGEVIELTAAIPIAAVSPDVMETGGVSLEAVPESQALRFEHRGPYATLRDTYARIEAWLRERGGIHSSADWARYAPMWEEYLNDPATTPESELVTRIYLTLP